MRRQNRAIGLIAAAAGLCLAGLLVVQALLLRQNFEWKRQAFRQDAAGALAGAVDKLEARETLKRIWTISFLKKGQSSYALLTDEDKFPSLHILARESVPKVQAEGGDIILTLAVPQRVRLFAVEPAGKADTPLLDETRPAGRTIIRIGRPGSGAAGPRKSRWIKLFLDDVLYNLTLENGTIVSVLAYPTVDQARVAMIDKVLEEYLVVHPTPVEQKVEKSELQAAVEEALRERGIALPCVYGIIPAGKQEVLLASDESRKDQLLLSEFRTRMFPRDMTVAAADLVFFFPGQEGSLFTRLGAPAVIALLFILAAAVCLFSILRAVAAQRRSARAMADFVNNMTHEFKTPISTISLACDALGQEPIRTDAGRQTKYRDMISSECRRMHDQVRKILETASLEKGDLDLRLERLDAHEMIREAVKAFSLIAEGRGGAIDTRLDAPDGIIEADPLHIRNVLHNLLDNALQYTRRPPQIVVATKTAGDMLRIEVADNGVGLSPEDQKRVFEKYYRVPTGNVHDVKGFGLGLSYVKLIVKAHRGSISVRSEEGQGSTFAVEMPFRRGGPRLRRAGGAA